MANVLLIDVTKHFGEIEVIRDVNIDIEDKEFLVLVGPSGCGKSTLLRMIAGLEDISSGVIKIDGNVVNDVPPKDRDIAMVFQNYALYPHMNVYNNMAFGLKMRHFPAAEINERVREAAKILEIEHLLNRKPAKLSGGQRQRVAMGRAIVRKPKVFLFDEPLSNLDAKLRMQMRLEIKKLHERLQTTVIYVTHDQVEAMTLAERIAVIDQGIIQQIAPPIEVYNNPANLFVGGFIGSPTMNFIPGKLQAIDNNFIVDAGSFSLLLPDHSVSKLADFKGNEVIAGIRPEHFHLSNQSKPQISIHATSEVLEPLGHEIILFARAGEHLLSAKLDAFADIKPHQSILLDVEKDKIKIFDKSSGVNLSIQ